jgi:hypothetical protein
MTTLLFIGEIGSEKLLDQDEYGKIRPRKAVARSEQERGIDCVVIRPSESSSENRGV